MPPDQQIRCFFGGYYGDRESSSVQRRNLIGHAARVRRSARAIPPLAHGAPAAVVRHIVVQAVETGEPVPAHLGELVGAQQSVFDDEPGPSEVVVELRGARQVVEQACN